MSTCHFHFYIKWLLHFSSKHDPNKTCVFNHFKWDLDNTRNLLTTELNRLNLRVSDQSFVIVSSVDSEQI